MFTSIKGKVSDKGTIMVTLLIIIIIDVSDIKIKTSQEDYINIGGDNCIEVTWTTRHT